MLSDTLTDLKSKLCAFGSASMVTDLKQLKDKYGEKHLLSGITEFLGCDTYLTKVEDQCKGQKKMHEANI